MAVKKAKEASFKKMDSAFATSQSAIQKVKNTDPLNGNEEQEQGNENVSIDPAHYLSKKEKKEWKRLSYTAKQRYIRQAERQLKRQKKRNGIAKTEPSSVQEKEKQAAKIFSKERKFRSHQEVPLQWILWSKQILMLQRALRRLYLLRQNR